MAYVELHAIQPIRSSTAPRTPRSSRCGRRSSATRRSRSPTTTASTARSSSRTRRSSSASAPITGAEVTLVGGAHVTLLVESSQGYANLCRLLTAAHAHTRPKEGELLPPALDPALLAELNEGLVCLSGCARDGLGVRDPNAAAALAGAFGPERFYVELQRPFERGDAHRNALLRDLAEHAGVETVVTGNVHAHHRAAHRAPGRPRRDPPQHLARVVRARAARQPRERPARAGGAARALPRRPRRRPAHGRGRGAARVRPDRRSSATATPTSPTAPSPRSSSSPRSATTRSPSATRQVTDCYLVRLARGSRRSWG